MLYLTTQKKFDKEMDTNYSNAVYSQWHNNITSEEKRKVAQFFENWLHRADDRTITNILTGRLIVETLRFFRNPEELLRRCDTSQFFSQHEVDGIEYFSVSYLVGQMFEHKLDRCVAVILSNPKVQDILNQNISRASDIFHPLATQERFGMATAFLDKVQDTFSPNIIFELLGSIMLNKNYELAANLNQRPQFQNFVADFGFDHYSMLSLNYLPAVHPQVIQRLPFSATMKLHIGLSIVQRSLEADNFDEKIWTPWLDEQDFDRVDFARHMLSTHFDDKKAEYLSGTSHVEAHQYNTMVEPVLNLLTRQDIARWRNTPWKLDKYYRVNQHNGFIKSALMDNVDLGQERKGKRI